jgi:hypothetical protein
MGLVPEIEGRADLPELQVRALGSPQGEEDVTAAEVAVPCPFTDAERMFTSLPFVASEFACPRCGSRLLTLFEPGVAFCAKCNGKVRLTGAP